MASSAALALPPAAPPARPRVLLVGTALAVAGTVMAFAGLIGVYLAQRHAVLAQGGTWLPDGTSLPLTPGTIGMATMALSGVTIWWAVDAVGRVLLLLVGVQGLRILVPEYQHFNSIR